MRPSEVLPVFTQEEINSINAFQMCGFLHPIMCPNRHTNRHTSPHPDGEGRLIATPEGLQCPYCNFTKDSALAVMKDWSWKKLFPISTINGNRQRRA